MCARKVAIAARAFVRDRSDVARAPRLREAVQAPGCLRIVDVLAAQLAERERAVCEQADVLAKADLVERLLIAAIHQVVGVLDRSDARQAIAFGDLDEF